VGLSTDEATEIFNLPNPSSCTMALGVYSASNRNEYKIFLGLKRRLTTYPTSVSQLYKQCGILDISQTYMSPWPVIGTGSLFSFFSLYISFIMNLCRKNIL
jgi:hypothetical protein